jgi:hypothetical protein
MKDVNSPNGANNSSIIFIAITFLALEMVGIKEKFEDYGSYVNWPSSAN